MYQVLDYIKERPHMLLGNRSVMHLYSFLLGFEIARSHYRIPESEDEKDFANFQDWVANRFGITSGQTWAQIILFFSADEAESLDLFFQLLDEYRNRASQGQ